MNILIPDSWLREFLKTKATTKQIAESLSLCSQSVEKISKVGSDWIYEIEVTTNRPDCLSVYGIARELSAILPRFGIPAKLLPLQHPTYKIQHTTKNLPLEVKIADSSLCPRFTALIFDNIKIGPSPKIVQERLEKSNIRALNNVIDISNYLMLQLGQPMHTFDYDKIKGAKMVLREAKEGEKFTTLDGQTRILPQGAIVIEDGEGRIIDLCGIMGGENSAVDENTKRVLLFVQTYNPSKIRQTCQKLAFRTEAANRFEKGVDPEGVMVAMGKAIEMFKRNCDAKIASNLIDIYPNPLKVKTIKLNLNLVNKIIGIKIPKNEVINILRSLGFSILNFKFSILNCVVPHWRNGDIEIPEDLIEEIARIYGYHNLQGIVPLESPKMVGETPFFWEEKIKNTLKYLGFTEIVSYSMISEDLLTKVYLKPEDYLKISNPLSFDLVYMRPTLILEILQTISQNQDNFSDIKIFELANIYIPQGEGNLPEEILMLAGGQTGNKFLEIKGILEALFDDLGIKDYKFTRPVSCPKILNPAKSTEILINGSPAGTVGEIDSSVCCRFEISSKVVIFDLEFNLLTKHATNLKKYTPISSYPPIIEDLAFIVPPKTFVGDLIQLIKESSLIIQSVELLDSFKDTRTFRITYQHPKRTLTNKEVEKIRKVIIRKIEYKLKARLKNS